MATRTFDCTRNIAVLDNSTEDTSQLFVGQNAGILARVFMKFDPDFTGMASITSATLHVHMQSTYDGPITVQVRELTGSFSESTTNWSNQPGITGAIDDFVANNPGGWETVDITDIVTAWAPVSKGGSGDTAYGIRLKSSSEGVQGYVEFHSRFSGGNEPYITVVYATNSAPNAPTLTSPSNGSVVSSQTPTLSFTHNDPDGDPISAYQIQVDNNSDFSSPTWNSGKTSTSDETPSIVCGASLTRGVTYYWRAKTWDDSDAGGSYSTAKHFTVGSLPTTGVTSPSADNLAAPLYYTPGSNTTPKFQIGWSFACAEGGSQSSAHVYIYDDATNTLQHTHSHTGSATTASVSGYAPVNGTKYRVAVDVTCSHGLTSSITAHRPLRARWGRASYFADLGATPVTLSVAANTTLNSGQVILEYASSAGVGSEPATYYSDIALATWARYAWHRVTLLPQSVAAPTSPALNDLTWSYSANVLTPDKWTLSAQYQGDESTYVYGTLSLKGSPVGSSTTATQVVATTPNTNYILSGRMKTSGQPNATIKVKDAGGGVLATLTASADTDWTRYSSSVFGSGSATSLTVEIACSGSTGTFAWFDALKLEASIVVTPWTPGFLGQGATLDASGVGVDAMNGGIFRLRGSGGGITSLGADGLVLDSSATIKATGGEWILKGDGTITRPWTTYTPTIGGGGTATFTTLTGRYLKVGKMVHVEIAITVNAVGAGGGNITVTAPSTIDMSTLAIRPTLVMHYNGMTGLTPNAGVGWASRLVGSGDGNTLENLKTYDNTNIARANFTASTTIYISGFYTEV